MSGFTASTVLAPAARAGGAALGATAELLGRALHRVKPLHPDGALFHATVSRVGSGGAVSGVPFIDVAGDSAAVVRVSRAVGLPSPLPDFAGLAIRVEPDAGPGAEPGSGPADLLLASTGTGRLSRFLLLPRLPGRTGTMTTLLPYRSPRGTVVIAAVPRGERGYELCWASATGGWRTFALLHLGARYDGDPAISFDPVLNLLPGLSQLDWVRRLREPAYRRARAQSHRPQPA